MNLKRYIKEIRKITQEKAAGELNISRVHLNNIINDTEEPGKKLAKLIQVWSDGIVRAADLLKLN